MDRNSRRALGYAFIVTLGGFIFGLDAAVISGTVRFVATEFGLSDLQVGMVVSAPGLGVLFALLIAGYVSDRFGRKKALLVVAGLYLVSAVTSAIAPNYESLVAARFLGGLAFTSLSLASMYIGEVAPSEFRGKMVSMNQLNIVLGLSAAYFVNFLILKASQSGAGWVETLGITQYTWRWMLGSEIVPALIWFALLFLIPESPRWLVFNGHPERAREVMKRVREERRIDPEIADMQASMHLAHDSRSVGKQLKELFDPRMRLVLVVGLAIAAVQPLTGINAVLFYAPTIFETLGIGTDAAFQQAVWVGLVSIVATACALLIIDKVGRRPIVIWGLVWLVGSLLICSYGFKQATYTLSEDALVQLQELIDTEALQPLIGETYDSDTEFKAALHGTIGVERTRDEANVIYQQAAKLSPVLILFGIMSFIAAFQFSVGPVMWVLFSEIFPIALRGIAIPAFAFITSILSYFVQQFFPWQLTVMGASAIFLSYAGMAAIGLAVLFFKLPETKNKSIEEIERMFNASQDA